MKILLLGVNGQIGWELKHSLPQVGDVKAYPRSVVDLGKFDSIRNSIAEYNPDVIVNAAAYTAVDKAEIEPEQAKRINADAVDILARESKQRDALLIHYSTDYVFNGKKSDPYIETDVTDALSVYGKTKLGGEEVIKESGCKYFILRTSWVFGLHGKNFVKTILKLALERETLDVVADQSGVPSSASFVAKVTQEIIEKISNKPWPFGIYHVVPRGQATWHELACYIVDEARKHKIPVKLKSESINPITSAEYAVAAKRPSNSKLDNSKLMNLLSFELPRWQDEVTNVVKNISLEELAA